MSRKVPGIVWVVALLFAGFVVQQVWPDQDWTPIVLTGIGVIVSTVKIYLTAEERKILEQIPGAESSLRTSTADNAKKRWPSVVSSVLFG